MKREHPKSWVGKVFTYKKEPKKDVLKPIERHVFIVSKVSLLPNGYKIIIDFNNGPCLVYHSRKFRKIFRKATTEDRIQARAWSFYLNTQVRRKYDASNGWSNHIGIWGQT